jgi:2-polyprenyl-3-methyl-5-hydroxy-6-metoxy-1,4-benzoquinol methylase
MTAPNLKSDRPWVKQLGELRAAKGWWHSFELPDGTTIDGVHPVPVLKQRLAPFGIPEDLRGKRVLDIGTWDGWFAFEMERRGAAVVAIDNWDNPRFRQIHDALNSRVEYRCMDMFDLTPDRVGRFDIVLFMGVLYHLKHPLLALERVCGLTTGMAAVESFVLREGHCPGENVEKRALIEFYETDEFGGQTDNWTGPSLPGLLALCRTAGFARVELRNTTEYGVSVACYRKWDVPLLDGAGPPRLTRVEHNTKTGIHFDSRQDEYVSVWFTCAERQLGLDAVKPEICGYGVRPISVARLEDGSWQANFKLPPGLEAGWHDVTVRLEDGPRSNAKLIAVDLTSEQPPRIRTARPSCTADFKGLNVQQVVSDIHARVRKEQHAEAPPSGDSYELGALRAAYQRLFESRNSVGKLPPAPDTLRAKIGAYLVRGVQRCLFWYTPPILQFQNDAVGVLNSACNLIGQLSKRTAGLEREIHKLRRDALESTSELISRESERTAELEQEVHRLRRELLESACNLVSRQGEKVASLEEDVRKLQSQHTLPDTFQFELQDRFRGSEKETAGKLNVYLETLQSLLPSLPQGEWLDIGCGRGEWLDAVSKLGRRAMGIDANPLSVARCREKGFSAEEAEALPYLRTLDEGSAALVTAFHVVEHWTMQDVLALVHEAFRILKPGGLLIVETPDPANVVVGCTEFWNDPTHARPVPLKLLEFVFEYFGFNVVNRLRLNPRSQAVEQTSTQDPLNDYFYGPQDYGLIGRR